MITLSGTEMHLPISKEFMDQRENVISAGLVGSRTSEEYSKNVYLVPVPLEKISCFGSKNISPAHSQRLCNAVDFYAPEGTSVLAAAEGKIVEVKEDSDESGIRIEFWDKGNYIDIKHKNDEFTWYEHLKYRGALVKKGDTVKKGQVIGYSGNTGFTENPHLHFQVNKYFGKGPDDYVTLRARFEEIDDVYAYDWPITLKKG
jgi:murein DD-endopeptidase MepM/ murein hydrolase activator NlpD